jgi:protein-S-isoprenylcysteine O-methyltransferase Ste14
MIPAVLLTLLYLTIALRKTMSAAEELAEINAGDWARHLTIALHLGSGAIFFGIIGSLMLTRKEPLRREKRLIGWALPLIVTLSMSVVGWYEPRDFPAGVMLVSTFFVVIGTAFTIYALRHLGKHFGVVSDVRGLVTTGPYRWVRHPLYGGETLTTIGFVIAVASPLTIAVFSVGLALQIWRAKVEEQALTATFHEYREYAARTPMLIPLTKLHPTWFQQRAADSASSVPGHGQPRALDS